MKPKSGRFIILDLKQRLFLPALKLFQKETPVSLSSHKRAREQKRKSFCVAKVFVEIQVEDRYAQEEDEV